MVGVLLGLPVEPPSDHAADALAVAICHAAHVQGSSALARRRSAAPAAGAPRGRRSIDRRRQRRDPLATSRPRRRRCRRRRLPARRLLRDAARWCPPAGQHVFLHAHLISRDDSLALYGFATEDERELFLSLISRLRRRAEGGARGALRRPASASCSARSPAGTRSASRRCPGSASAPPSGSSSSCARRSPGSSRRASSATPPRRRGRARRRARACSGSATRPWRPSGCSTAAEGETRRGARRVGPAPGTQRSRRRVSRTLSAMSIERIPLNEAAIAADAEPRIADARDRERGGGPRSQPAALAARRLRQPASRSPTSSRSSSRRRGAAASRSTTSCSPARPGSARPRSPTSSPPRWACRWSRPPARRSSARPTSPAS